MPFLSRSVASRFRASFSIPSPRKNLRPSAYARVGEDKIDWKSTAISSFSIRKHLFQRVVAPLAHRWMIIKVPDVYGIIPTPLTFLAIGLCDLNREFCTLTHLDLRDNKYISQLVKVIDQKACGRRVSCEYDLGLERRSDLFVVAGGFERLEHFVADREQAVPVCHQSRVVSVGHLREF